MRSRVSGRLPGRQHGQHFVSHDRTSNERIEKEKLVTALADSVRLSTFPLSRGAEQNLFAGQLTLARLRSQELQSVVQLYAALGGGWK
jgi:multidrug efflux system outer membrane protein